jgi:MFS family permease
VSAVLYYTNQQFFAYLPYGLFYSACLTLLGILLSNYLPPEASPGESSPTAKPKAPVSAIIGILGLFISVIIAGKALAFSNSLLLVSFVSVIYTLAWCLLLRRKEAFLQELANYKKNTLTSKSELLLFLGVGFLGVIMSNTPIKLVIKYILTSVSEFPTFLIIIFIHLTIIILSSISIHQLISITALALTASPQDLGLSQMQFCLMLVGSYTLSTTLSPCVPYNIMLSNLLGTSVLNITYRYNLVYGLSAVVLSAVIISLIIR